MLFTAAKATHLNVLPQGGPERDERTLNMVAAMEREEFGSCTNHAECEAVCPKEIPLEFIARLNRDLLRRRLPPPPRAAGRPRHAPGPRRRGVKSAAAHSSKSIGALGQVNRTIILNEEGKKAGKISTGNNAALGFEDCLGEVHYQTVLPAYSYQLRANRCGSPHQQLARSSLRVPSPILFVPAFLLSSSSLMTSYLSPQPRTRTAARGFSATDHIDLTPSA